MNILNGNIHHLFLLSLEKTQYLYIIKFVSSSIGAMNRL